MSAHDPLRVLRSPGTIRARCARILEVGLADGLAHFRVNLEQLSEAARFTAEVTRARYPDLQIPAHSRFAHFDAAPEGEPPVPRLAHVLRALADRDARERARVLVDLVIVSVLLDAGAGASWRFRDPDTGHALGRSEGLAIASLAWVAQGGLSARGRPYEVDAEGLAAVTPARLRTAFQVTPDNPLVGVEGRVHLLRALADVLRTRADLFSPAARLGALLDTLAQGSAGGALPAHTLLATLLDGLSPIWPGRLTLGGAPLGDVWAHPAAGGEAETQGLVPFHKLSQWLAYSLLFPLAIYGLPVRELDALTGLAEYRNGGLFVDLGVIRPRAPDAHAHVHEVGAELVVEWRALTVALLDRIAPLVARELGVSLTLPALLEGGTWAAGRAIARKLRPDGAPPFRIASDGTVF